MALLDSELARIKVELGFNVLSVGAEPYIGVAAIFEQVIKPYMTGGASTTSSTAVSASTAPALVTLTLNSASGFSAGDRIIVDVDDWQEVATARNLSGTSLSLLLSKAHEGTYPVTVEGGESMLREALNQIRGVKAEMATAFGFGALKRCDDIEWYEVEGKSSFGVLGENLSYWREQLASLLGIRSNWKRKQAGGSRVAVY